MVEHAVAEATSDLSRIAAGLAMASGSTAVTASAAAKVAPAAADAWSKCVSQANRAGSTHRNIFEVSNLRGRCRRPRFRLRPRPRPGPRPRPRHRSRRRHRRRRRWRWRSKQFGFMSAGSL